MGLDASVMCNCYQEGKTTPCPFPQNYYVDEDGFPTLDLPYEQNENHYETFDEWLSTCCDHPNMDYAAVFVAHSKGYESFLQALEQLGWQYFPTLHSELPHENHGLTHSTSAQTALHELDFFKTKGEGLTKTFLINSDTGEPLASSTLAYGGMFGWNGRTGMSLGFDENGFYIVDAWELNREMFRAMRFEQHIVEPTSLDKASQFEFVDLDSGRAFVCSTPLKLFARDRVGQLKQEYPQRVHVEQRGVGTQYFTYILEPLTYIFQAAVETGNPVRWA